MTSKFDRHVTFRIWLCPHIEMMPTRVTFQKFCIQPWSWHVTFSRILVGEKKFRKYVTFLHFSEAVIRHFGKKWKKLRKYVTFLQFYEAVIRHFGKKWKKLRKYVTFLQFYEAVIRHFGKNEKIEEVCNFSSVLWSCH